MKQIKGKVFFREKRFNATSRRSSAKRNFLFFFAWMSFARSVFCNPGADGIVLAYRFHQNQTIRYLIERQDSLFTTAAGAHKATVYFFRIRQSIHVVESNTDARIGVVVATDSIWQGPSSGDPINNYEKMLFGSEFKSPEEKIAISESGGTLSGESRFIPFLIPLSETPVSADASWNFDIQKPYQNPFEGSVRTQGVCQLYATQEDGENSVAVVAVRLDKSNSAKMTIKEPFQTFTTTYDTEENGSGVLYFNISKGWIEKGIIKWAGTVVEKGPGQNNLYQKKSRLIFRLLP
jgi:hypothetical protein